MSRLVAKYFENLSKSQGATSGNSLWQYRIRPDRNSESQAPSFSLSRTNVLKKINLAGIERNPRDIVQFSCFILHDFYLLDDITWQAPGRKDRVINRERRDRKKVKTMIQTRYMNASRLQLEGGNFAAIYGVTRRFQLLPT